MTGPFPRHSSPGARSGDTRPQASGLRPVPWRGPCASKPRQEVLMRRYLRKSAFFAVAIVLTVPVFGQYSPGWKTAADVREGVSGTIVGTAVDVNDASYQLQLTADEDRYGRITVQTDSLTTQYNGFGDVIAGKPEIFIGSKGFANIREGD